MFTKKEHRGAHACRTPWPARRRPCLDAIPHQSPDGTTQPPKGNDRCVVARPLPGPPANVEKANATHQGQDHSHHRVGDRLGTVIGNVGHCDSSGRSVLVINVFETGAALDNHFAALESIDRLGRHDQRMIDNARGRIFHLAHQFLFVVGPSAST